MTWERLADVVLGLLLTIALVGAGWFAWFGWKLCHTFTCAWSGIR